MQQVLTLILPHTVHAVITGVCSPVQLLYYGVLWCQTGPSFVCAARAASLFCVQIEVARTGDKVALGSLKDIMPGETRCDEKHPIMLECNEFPTDPVTKVRSATGHCAPRIILS